MSKILAEKLTALRKSHGFSRQAMADKLQMSVNTYQKYEFDQAEPKLETLLKISKLLQVSTDYLLGVEEKEGMTADDNRFEEELLEIYRSMPEEYRKLLYDGIKAAVLRHHNVPDEPGNEKPESGCTPMPWAKPEIKESKEAAARHTSSDNRKKTPPPDNILIEVTEDDGI